LATGVFLNRIFPIKIIGLIGLLMLSSIGLTAQEMDVPMNLQYSLIGKILSFNRSLKSHPNGDVVVGILYQSKFRISLNAKNELLTYAKTDVNNKIGSHTVQWVGIELNSGDDITSLLETANIDILYVAPMRNVAIQDIAQITRAKQILSLTGIPEYLEEGLAVGIGSKGEKPFIYVNLAAAKAEGADFNSQFLKFVQIVETVKQ
jgi:hypothetical protein